MTETAFQPNLSIGIDIGGTFTDFVVYNNHTKQLFSKKVLSTPEAPEIAVIEGIKSILAEQNAALPAIKAIFHGSTVATNALLERKGARTALITTAGFRDVLEIGRQNRPELYNLATPLRTPLVPAENRLEVRERLDKDGNILLPLQPEFSELNAAIDQQEIESLAICLLFSFVNPEHEQKLSHSLERDDLLICLSSDILPEFREYERTSTTVINAYVTPVLQRYLQRLETYIGGTKFFVMQSNGGSISATEAGREGVRCILSGPAGGVAAAGYFRDLIRSSQTESVSGLITFDMGGTSTDVSLIKQTPTLTREAQIDGYPIALSMLDIHTIGSGGGSIAAVDPGGALQVGPQSAGADPGPACYGSGSLPTVTDANLVLGRIRADHFLGGAMPLFPQRAHRAIERVAQEINLPIPDCAAGIIAIANSHMAKALRVISVEKGEDPADFTLLSFGGAGGLHAVELARLVGIPRVCIPQTASVFSAFGMLVADTIKNYSRTVMASADRGYDWFIQTVEPLRKQAEIDLTEEGIQTADINVNRQLDMRYKGQSYEITVALEPDFIDRFHRAHKQAYGYSLQDHPIEVVNMRVNASGRKPEQIHLASVAAPENTLAKAHLGNYPVVLNSIDGTDHTGPILKTPIPFFLAESLPEQVPFKGPAVIIRPDTMVYIGRQDTVLVDERHNILVTLEQ